MAAKRKVKAKPKPKPKGKAKASKPKAKQAPPIPKLDLPPIKVPPLPAVEGYVNSLPSPLKALVIELRRIVRDAAPEAVELLHDNSPAYAANGLFARIEAKDRGVLLSFVKGAWLEAPTGVLVGAGDERGLMVTLEGTKETLLRNLVRQAVMLNLDQDPSKAS